MKTKTKTMLAMLALGASAFVVNAQDANTQNGGDQNGPPSRGHRPPPPAIIAAIDANHDGVIDANEIANTSAALKTLDKNGDGVLTPDEFMGKRPQHSSQNKADSNRARGDNSGGTPDNMPPGPPPNGQ